MNYLGVFLAAMLQIGLVAFQTVQIAQIESIQYASVRIFFISMTISVIWLININNGIKKCKLTKLMYMFGSSSGAVVGANFSTYLS